MDKDVQVTDDQQAELAFDGGFTGEVAAPEKTPATVKTVEKPAEAAPVAEKTPAVPVVDAAPAVKHVQLTQEQFDSIMGTVTKTAALETQLNKLNGSFGNMHQIVEALKAATPKGVAVEIPDDVIDDMKADYPELADQMLKVLRKALAGKVGTGTVEKKEEVKTTSVDPETVGKIVKDENERREIDALNDDHPTWREIVGIVDKDGNLLDPNNPFRAWLAKQPPAYQTKVNTARRASTISKAIDAFNAAKAKAAAEAKLLPKTPPKGAVRRDVIKDAVQPKGDSSTPSPANSEAAAFDEGFKRG